MSNLPFDASHDSYYNISGSAGNIFGVILKLSAVASTVARNIPLIETFTRLLDSVNAESSNSAASLASS